MTIFVPASIGDVYPLLFERTALGYLSVAVVFAAMAGLRHPEISSQVVLQSFADILSLTLLMHASGGVNSGIGMLLAVATAGAVSLVNAVLPSCSPRWRRSRCLLNKL